MCILLAPIKTSVKTETTNKDIQLDQRRYTYNKVGPLISLKALCFGYALSGACLLIILLTVFNLPQI